MSDPSAFERAMGAIGRLIEELEAEPPTSTRYRAQELLRVVLEVHGLGLRRMLDMLRQHAGEDVVRRIEQDAQLASLLSLHELDRVGAEEALISLSQLRPVLRVAEIEEP